MFDFVDTSGLPEWARVVVEPDTRWDPVRGVLAPVSVVAGSVVDAVAVLVERGVVADPVLTAPVLVTVVVVVVGLMLMM